jgi:hypothetical protein
MAEVDDTYGPVPREVQQAAYDGISSIRQNSDEAGW